MRSSASRVPYDVLLKDDHHLTEVLLCFPEFSLPRMLCTLGDFPKRTELCRVCGTEALTQSPAEQLNCTGRTPVTGLSLSVALGAHNLSQVRSDRTAWGTHTRDDHHLFHMRVASLGACCAAVLNSSASLLCIRYRMHNLFTIVT